MFLYLEERYYYNYYYRTGTIQFKNIKAETKKPIVVPMYEYMFIIALPIFTFKFVLVPVHIALIIFTFIFIRKLLHKIYTTNIVTNSIPTSITPTNSNNALITMPHCD